IINPRAEFVERIRLHQQLAGGKARTHSIAKLLRGKPVKFLQGAVTQIQPSQKHLHVQTESGKETVSYDILIYAAGSITNPDSVPGVRDYAYTLSADSVARMAAKLPEVVAKGGRLLVIGGG